ncbi:transglutaminase-like cysteine peptidase [Massilia sp. H-1]|nr:transglutaminase-like cysteine peptidase [Massilia sp. H-1]
MAVWGKSDFWATPFEAMIKGKGDCEDFVIAKYFSLLALEVPDSQLRLIYVRAPGRPCQRRPASPHGAGLLPGAGRRPAHSRQPDHRDPPGRAPQRPGAGVQLQPGRRVF